MNSMLNLGSSKLELNTLFIQPSRFCARECKNCLPAGTMIKTSKGQVPVEQIQSGDKVYAYNSSLEQLELHQVGDTYLRQTDEVFELEVDGEILQLTGEHPVMTRRGWVKARDLTLDDEVLCDDCHTK